MDVKVKEYPDGTILVDGEVIKGAKDAYQEDRIVEAFALLHAFIEWEMVNLYEQDYLHKGGYLHELEEKGVVQQYKFTWLRAELRKRKLIDQGQDQSLGKWYDLRNRIIHRLVAYSYHNYSRNRITREEVKQGFHVGEEIAEFLRSRLAHLGS